MGQERQAAKQLNGGVVRLSVVLDDDLAEYVRLRAFQERTSRSAYVRDLVEQDAQAHPTSVAAQEANR
jgi:hypothetical protein